MSVEALNIAAVQTAQSARRIDPLVDAAPARDRPSISGILRAPDRLETDAPLQPEDAPADETETLELVEQLRAELNSRFRSVLRIDRNEDAGKFTYTLVDPQTQETRLQWPPESYLELLAFLNNPEGGLVNRTA